MAPSTPVPPKKFDSQGKVTNWSQVWPEAQELETLVINGMVDGMTPAQICQKFPSYNAFAYRPLSSALANFRNKHNKEITNRAVYDANGAVCECRRRICFVVLCPCGFIVVDDSVNHSQVWRLLLLLFILFPLQTKD